MSKNLHSPSKTQHTDVLLKESGVFTDSWQEKKEFRLVVVLVKMLLRSCFSFDVAAETIGPVFLLLLRVKL